MEGPVYRPSDPPEDMEDLPRRGSLKIPIPAMTPRRARCGEGVSLLVMLVVATLCNFDHGAIPACIGEIEAEFGMSFIQQSLLGSLVYFGLVLGTIVAGFLIIRYPAKPLIGVSLFCVGISLFGFSKGWNLWVLYTARFLTGFFEAFSIVYLPIWVDEFAPVLSTTRWMSYTQLASIFGTVLGYFLAGIFSQPRLKHLKEEYHMGWHSCFQIQALLVIPVLIALLSMPSGQLNVHAHTESPISAHPSVVDYHQLLPSASESMLNPLLGRVPSTKSKSPSMYDLKGLLSNRVYLLVTLCLSNLYFVVTGIQFWVTEYMIDVLGKTKLEVVSFATICFLTAPTSGVYMGGFIGDYVRGNKDNSSNTVRLLVLFAGVASSLAVGAALVHQSWIFAALIWGCLFSGACLVPIAMGISMANVKLEHRPLSSAVSQFSFNLLGWFAAPLVSGCVMDLVSGRGYVAPIPLACGFRFVLLMSLGGLLCTIAASLCVDSRHSSVEFELVSVDSP